MKSDDRPTKILLQFVTCKAVDLRKPALEYITRAVRGVAFVLASDSAYSRC